MRETEPNDCVLDFADEHGRHAHLDASYPDEAGSTTASRTGRRDKGTRLSSQRSYFPLKGPYIHEPRRDGDHWERTLTAVDNHDTQMCQSWKEEIDMLLVFAGLFTASVTAFTVESYQWLQPDPHDKTNDLLLFIAQQLNQSNPLAPAMSAGTFTLESSAVRINCFWFLSITISLTAGLIAILCKQWMREFQRETVLPTKRSLALRQLRYLGWEKWGIRYIMASPAILLQAALVLFFIGLVDLLWSRMQSIMVAALVTSVVGIVGLLMLLTTVLPAFQHLRRPSSTVGHGILHPCPYKSPQSRLMIKIYEMGRWFIRGITTQGWRHRLRDHTWLDLETEMLQIQVKKCGCTFDNVPAEKVYLSRALRWVTDVAATTALIRDDAYQCIQDSRIACRNGRLHVWFHETSRGCLRDPDPDRHLFPLFLYNHEPEQEFCLEIALRSHFTGSSSKYLTRMIFYLARDIGAKAPEVLAKQTLKCFKGLLEGGEELPDDAWRSLFALCLPSARYDSVFREVLEYCHTTILTSPGSERCRHLAQQLLSDLWLLYMHQRYILHRPFIFRSVTSERTIFTPFFNLLKHLHPLLSSADRSDSDYWLLLQSDIVKQTTLPENFFEPGGPDLHMSFGTMDEKDGSFSTESGDEEELYLNPVRPSASATRRYHRELEARENRIVALLRGK